MKNKNALVSTAMLFAIWENERHDTLDLMIPFIKYIIGKSYSIGAKISIKTIIQQLSDSFGLNEVPEAILVTLMNRLVKVGDLKGKIYNYTLASDLTMFLEMFEAKRKKALDEIDHVISSLSQYLSSKCIRGVSSSAFSKENVKELFSSFLTSHALETLSDISKLDEMEHEAKQEVIAYHIGQFVLNEYQRDSEIFHSIINIVEGHMISHIIYLKQDIDNADTFKSVNFYLDTVFLLKLLGYKTKQEKDSAEALAKLLIDANANLRCFPNTYSEITGIVEYYKKTMLSPEKRNGLTLEYFDANKYNTEKIDYIIETLEEQLINRGVLVNKDYSRDRMISEHEYNMYIKEDELESCLQVNMFYRSKEALRNDVISVASINRYRRNEPCTKMENCKAIFITTNKTLVYYCNKHLGHKKYSNNVPLLLTDLDLTTLLWLKNFRKNTTLPALKLVENASLSMSMTKTVREAFIKRIKELEYEQSVTPETASRYVQAVFLNREKALARIDGDPDNIGNLNLEDFNALAAAHYNEELYKKNETLAVKIEETAAERETANENYTQAAEMLNAMMVENEVLRQKLTCQENIYEIRINEEREERERARNELKNEKADIRKALMTRAELSKNKVVSKLSFLRNVLFALFGIGAVIGITMQFFNQQSHSFIQIVICIIVILASISQLVDWWDSKLRFTSQVIERLGERRYAAVVAKEKRFYSACKNNNSSEE